MDDLDHSLHIAEYDWRSFYEESEECGLLQPSLACLDNSSFSDSEDSGIPAYPVFNTVVLPPSTIANSDISQPDAMAEEQCTGYIKRSVQVNLSGMGGQPRDITITNEEDSAALGSALVVQDDSETRLHHPGENMVQTETAEQIAELTNYSATPVQCSDGADDISASTDGTKGSSTQEPDPPACAHVGPDPPACAHMGPDPPACAHVEPDPPACAHVGPDPPACAHMGPDPPACAHVEPDPPVCAHVEPDPPACAHVGPDPPACAHMGPDPPACAHVEPDPPVCAHVEPDPPACAHVEPDPPVCAHVGPDPPACAHVGPDPPACAHVGPDPPACAHVGPDLPACAHVELNMNTLHKEEDSGVASRTEKERWFVTVNDSPLRRRGVSTSSVKKKRRKTTTCRSRHQACSGPQEGGKDAVAQSHQNSGLHPSVEILPHKYTTSLPCSEEENISKNMDTASHCTEADTTEICISLETPPISILHEFTPKGEHTLESIESDAGVELFSTHSCDSENCLSAAEEEPRPSSPTTSDRQISALTENANGNSQSPFKESSPQGHTPQQSESYQTTTFPSAGRDTTEDSWTSDNDTDSTISHVSSDTPELQEHESPTELTRSASDQLESPPDLTVTPSSTDDGPLGPTRPIYAISAFWDEMERLTIKDILRLRTAASPSPSETQEDVLDAHTQEGSSFYTTEDLLPNGASMDASDTADSDYSSKPDRSSCEFSTFSDCDEEYWQCIGASRNASPDPHTVNQLSQRTTDSPTDSTEESTNPAGKETNPAGKETNPAGKETNPAGKETNPAGKETNPAGKETNPAGKETNPAGKEMNPAGKETNPAGKETHPAGKETNPAGKETNPAGKETNPAGKETNPAGKETNPAGKETNPAGKETNPAGKEMNPAGKETNPAGKETTAALEKFAGRCLDDRGSHILLSSELACPRGITKSKSMHNVQALNTEIQRKDAPLKPVREKNLFLEENMVFDVSGSITPAPILCNTDILDENYRISFSEVFDYLVTEDETKNDSRSVTVYDSKDISTGLAYDYTLSMYRLEMSLSSLQDSQYGEEKPNPIFSCSQLTVRDLTFPEPGYLFSPRDTYVEEEDDDSPIRAASTSASSTVTPGNAKGSASSTVTPGNAKGWSSRLKSLLSMRKVRLPDKGSIWCRRSDGWVFPVEAQRDDPALTLFNDRRALLSSKRTSLVEQDCLFSSLQQSDMCLVCIAVASWVLRSSDRQAADAWKAALLANVSAISAIQYLRQYVKKDPPQDEP